MAKQNGWTSDDIQNMDGKVAIVTGANSGLGYETARALARKGAAVTLACRNPKRGETALAKLKAELPKAELSLELLDLSDLESVAAFADRFLESGRPLHLLVNNAGVMVPPLSRTAQGHELQFGTNHLGHFALTGRLLGRLLETPGSRVVTVSSMAHKFGHIDFEDLDWENKKYKRWRAYGQSKLANLLFTYELQRRLAAAGRETIAVASHPGWTATELQRHDGMSNRLNGLLAQSQDQGALPSLYGAAAPDVQGGDYFGPSGWLEIKGLPKKVASNARSHDEEAAARLWQISEEMTGVRFAF